MNGSDLSVYFNWVKAFHIIFVICWFACIFYLPRLFINHVIATSDDTRAQLVIMMRKLFRFSVPFAILTIVTGTTLFSLNHAYYLSTIWFSVKVSLVAIFVIYHGICGVMVNQFAHNKNTRGHVFYRLFNELPVVFILFPVVILVVVKPF